MPRKPSPAQEGREQPLNVQIGKRAADDMFRRRDRSEARQRFATERPADAFRDWVEANFPYFPNWWFQR